MDYCDRLRYLLRYILCPFTFSGMTGEAAWTLLLRPPSAALPPRAAPAPPPWNHRNQRHRPSWSNGWHWAVRGPPTVCCTVTMADVTTDTVTEEEEQSRTGTVGTEGDRGQWWARETMTMCRRSGPAGDRSEPSPVFVTDLAKKRRLTDLNNSSTSLVYKIFVYCLSVFCLLFWKRQIFDT